MRLRAVRTAYGPRFYRSKTEARWAAFFDSIGVRFQYEPTKFNLGYCRYVPDFYLPDLGTWIEVKAENYGDAQLRKVRLVAEQTHERAFLFGAYDFAQPEGQKYGYGYIWKPRRLLYGGNMFAWGICPECDKPDIAEIGRADEMRCPCFTFDKGETVYADESNRLMRAYRHVATLFQTPVITKKKHRITAQ